MPQAPAAPPVPDYYLVIPIKNSPGADRADLTDEQMPQGVHASLMSYVVEATQEEEAVAKVAPIAPEADRFFVAIAPTFPRP
jgi:hypothetical protein